MPFKVNQHHSQKAEKDLHKAKVEFTQGKKSRSVYFFSCTLSLGLAVFSVLAV